jgi:hypothetical protein
VTWPSATRTASPNNPLSVSRSNMGVLTNEQPPSGGEMTSA